MATPGPGRRSRATVAAAIAGVVALAAVAALIVVLTSKPSRPSVAQRPAAAPAQSPSPAGSGAATSASTGPGSPATSSTTTPGQSSGAPDPTADIGAINDVLLAHHKDLVARDYQAAWALESPRYRAEKLRSEGYDAWVQTQQSLTQYLDPAGLRATVVSWDPNEHVATVRLSGMRWTAPNSSCSYWQGVTWVAYDGGRWYYEPGYSVSPARRALWQNKTNELLGSGCG